MVAFIFIKNCKKGGKGLWNWGVAGEGRHLGLAK